jgi:large subunit ribosomal protein L35
MPKMKTRKSAAKRFKLTGTGKVAYRHTRRSHLLTKKSASRKRRLATPATLPAGEARKIKRNLARG